MNNEELNSNEILEFGNDYQEEKIEVKKTPGRRGKKKKTTSKDIIKKTIDMSRETEKQLIVIIIHNILKKSSKITHIV